MSLLLRSTSTFPARCAGFFSTGSPSSASPALAPSAGLGRAFAAGARLGCAEVVLAPAGLFFLIGGSLRFLNDGRGVGPASFWASGAAGARATAASCSSISGEGSRSFALLGAGGVCSSLSFAADLPTFSFPFASPPALPSFNLTVGRRFAAGSGSSSSSSSSMSTSLASR